MDYPVETFTEAERARLALHFTNLDRPVFALVNLPEVVKGALFARYSRSPKSLRRLFVDEFVGDLDLTGDLSFSASNLDDLSPLVLTKLTGALEAKASASTEQQNRGVPGER